MRFENVRPHLVLVVEDEADMAESYRMVLEGGGYEVVTAADGSQALHVLRRGLRPSVILLDLMMPVMDGIEFRRRQAADASIADIPVIVLSEVEELLDFVPVGKVAGCYRKPVDCEALLATIAGLCSRGSGARSAAVDSIQRGRPPGGEGEAPMSRGRVLIVDDFAEAVEALRLLMEGWGYDVATAATAATAADGLAQFAAWIPDVVVIDPTLPDMDGCEAIRRMKGVSPNAVVIAYSGLHQFKEPARTAGADGFILKPNLKALEEILAAHAAPHAARRGRLVR